MASSNEMPFLEESRDSFYSGMLAQNDYSSAAPTNFDGDNYGILPSPAFDSLEDAMNADFFKELASIGTSNEPQVALSAVGQDPFATTSSATTTSGPNNEASLKPAAPIEPQPMPSYQPESVYPNPDIAWQPRGAYGNIIQQQNPSMTTLNSAAPQFNDYSGNANGNYQYLVPTTNAYQGSSYNIPTASANTLQQSFNMQAPPSNNFQMAAPGANGFQMAAPMANISHPAAPQAYAYQQAGGIPMGTSFKQPVPMANTSHPAAPQAYAYQQAGGIPMGTSFQQAAPMANTFQQPAHLANNSQSAAPMVNNTLPAALPANNLQTATPVAGLSEDLFANWDPNEDYFPPNTVSSERKHKRTKDHKCLPSFVYTERLPDIPSWSSANGRPLFSYSKDGQWDHNLEFSREELAFYMGNCPRPMTMWLQNCPAQSNHRLDARDRRCRWRDCPLDGNTIQAGWLRVAFDEFADLTSAGRKDPFKVAGSMHFWCFEQCFDPLQLFNTGRLRPELRKFIKETKNPMILTRDSDSGIIDGALKPWILAQRRTPSKVFPRPHSESLSCCLIEYHLNNQTRARHNARMKRNANRRTSECKTLDIHKGDLGFYAMKRKEERDNPNRPGRWRKAAQVKTEEFDATKIGDEENPQSQADCIIVAAQPASNVMPTTPVAPTVTKNTGEVIDVDRLAPGTDNGAKTATPAPACGHVSKAEFRLPGAPESIGKSEDKVTEAGKPAPKKRSRSIVSNEDLYGGSPKRRRISEAQQPISKTPAQTDDSSTQNTVGNGQVNPNNKPERRDIPGEAKPAQRSVPETPAQSGDSSALSIAESVRLSVSPSLKRRSIPKEESDLQQLSPRKRTRNQTPSLDSLFGDAPSPARPCSREEERDGERQAGGIAKSIAERRRSVRSVSLQMGRSNMLRFPPPSAPASA